MIILQKQSCDWFIVTFSLSLS